MEGSPIWSPRTTLKIHIEKHTSGRTIIVLPLVCTMAYMFFAEGNPCRGVLFPCSFMSHHERTEMGSHSITMAVANYLSSYRNIAVRGRIFSPNDPMNSAPRSLLSHSLTSSACGGGHRIKHLRQLCTRTRTNAFIDLCNAARCLALTNLIFLLVNSTSTSCRTAQMAKFYCWQKYLL